MPRDDVCAICRTMGSGDIAKRHEGSRMSLATHRRLRRRWSSACRPRPALQTFNSILPRGCVPPAARGDPISTEIVIELAGKGRARRPLRTRHAVVHPEGQMPPTRLSADGSRKACRASARWTSRTSCSGWVLRATATPTAYLARFKQIGGMVLKLEAPRREMIPSRTVANRVL
jgi:hypothetical protein